MADPFVEPDTTGDHQLSSSELLEHYNTAIDVLSNLQRGEENFVLVPVLAGGGTLDVLNLGNYTHESDVEPGMVSTTETSTVNELAPDILGTQQQSTVLNYIETYTENSGEIIGQEKEVHAMGDSTGPIDGKDIPVDTRQMETLQQSNLHMDTDADKHLDYHWCEEHTETRLPHFNEQYPFGCDFDVDIDEEIEDNALLLKSSSNTYPCDQHHSKRVWHFNTNLPFECDFDCDIDYDIELAQNTSATANANILCNEHSGTIYPHFNCQYPFPCEYDSAIDYKVEFENNHDAATKGKDLPCLTVPERPIHEVEGVCDCDFDEDLDPWIKATKNREWADYIKSRRQEYRKNPDYLKKQAQISRDNRKKPQKEQSPQWWSNQRARKKINSANQRVRDALRASMLEEGQNEQGSGRTEENDNTAVDNPNQNIHHETKEAPTKKLKTKPLTCKNQVPLKRECKVHCERRPLLQSILKKYSLRKTKVTDSTGSTTKKVRFSVETKLLDKAPGCTSKKKSRTASKPCVSSKNKSVNKRDGNVSCGVQTRSKSKVFQNQCPENVFQRDSVGVKTRSQSKFLSSSQVSNKQKGNVFEKKVEIKIEDKKPTPVKMENIGYEIEQDILNKTMIESDGKKVASKDSTLNAPIEEKGEESLVMQMRCKKTNDPKLVKNIGKVCRKEPSVEQADIEENVHRTDKEVKNSSENGNTKKKKKCGRTSKAQKKKGPKSRIKKVKGPDRKTNDSIEELKRKVAASIALHRQKNQNNEELTQNIENIENDSTEIPTTVPCNDLNSCQGEYSGQFLESEILDNVQEIDYLDFQLHAQVEPVVELFGVFAEQIMVTPDEPSDNQNEKEKPNSIDNDCKWETWESFKARHCISSASDNNEDIDKEQVVTSPHPQVDGRQRLKRKCKKTEQCNKKRKKGESKSFLARVDWAANGGPGCSYWNMEELIRPAGYESPIRETGNSRTQPDLPNNSQRVIGTIFMVEVDSETEYDV